MLHYSEELSNFGNKALLTTKNLAIILNFLSKRWAGFKLALGFIDFIFHCCSLLFLFFGTLSTVVHFSIAWNTLITSFFLFGISVLFVYLDATLDVFCCKEFESLSSRLENFCLRIQDKKSDNLILEEIQTETQLWKANYKNSIVKVVVFITTFIIKFNKGPFSIQ